MTNEEIVKAIQAGNMELMGQLWEQCRAYIAKRAYRWKQAWGDRIDIDIDDLVQSGYFAVCNAVKGWEAEKECTFLYYLEWHLKSEFATVCSCRNTANRADPIYSALRFESPVAGTVDDLTVADTLGADCPELEAIEENDFREYTAKVVREAVARLPGKYREAVEAHFLEGIPYITIAENMGVSMQRAQQLGTRGLRKIRENGKNKELRELYFGERNLYQGTGYSTWRDTGMSAPEREVMRLEMLLNSIQQ